MIFIGCDESETGTCFLIGSVWLSERSLIDFERKVLEFRIENKYWREFHSKNLKKKGRSVDICLGFLEVAFSIPELRFATIVVDKDKKAIVTHHAGSFIKRQLVFLYLLISRRYKAWGVKEDPYIIFDDITSEEDSDAHREEFPKARKFIERYVGRELVSFAPCTSHVSSLVQLADILTGLVAHKWKVGKEGETPNEAKMELVRFLESRLGIDIASPTGPTTAPFNVWRHVKE